MSLEDAFERAELRGYVGVVRTDPDPEDPRVWDNLGTLVHWHRRYRLGDRRATAAELAALRRGGWPLLARFLRRTVGARHVLPVALLDHSGLHLWVGEGPHPSDPEGWDSVTVGWIMDTADGRARVGTPDEEIEVALEVGERGAVRGRRNAIEQQLHAEVAVYDQYLRGDVYGYTVTAPDGREVASCWDFFDLDEVRREMQASLAAAAGAS